MLTVDFERLGLKPGDRVLDAGCGPGRHSWEAFSQAGVDVVAADMSVNTARFALFMLDSMTVKNLSGGGSAHAVAADASCMPFADSSFDAVICSEVLEHIPDDRRAVLELARVLKPGGALVVSVPLYLPERICWALSGSYQDMAGGHVRIYRKKQLEGLFLEAGLKCKARRRAHALHSPLWWLKCLAAQTARASGLLKGYERFINWHVTRRPGVSMFAERLLAPLMAKSVVYYLQNEGDHEAQHVA